VEVGFLMAWMAEVLSLNMMISLLGGGDFSCDWIAIKIALISERKLYTWGHCLPSPDPYLSQFESKNIAK